MIKRSGNYKWKSDSSLIITLTISHLRNKPYCKHKTKYLVYLLALKNSIIPIYNFATNRHSISNLWMRNITFTGSFFDNTWATISSIHNRFMLSEATKRMHFFQQKETIGVFSLLFKANHSHSLFHWLPAHRIDEVLTCHSAGMHEEILGWNLKTLTVVNFLKIWLRFNDTRN